MKKIISLFERDYNGTRLVIDKIVPGAEWVINGEGIATRKFDGTCCLVKDGNLFKRYDTKNGKIPPSDFIPAQDPDPITGHWPGWIPICSNDIYHIEAWEYFKNHYLGFVDGTFELCGPRINLNTESLDKHILVRHGCIQFQTPRTFNELKEWFKGKDIEGIVWHHEDGRMVKIKKKDFGYSRFD